MKIIFYDLERSNSYLFRYDLAYSVKFVNKMSEEGIGGSGEGPLLPLYRPARSLSSSKQYRTGLSLSPV